MTVETTVLTETQRRQYHVQFSPEIIQKPGGSGPAGGAEPFLLHGKRVI